MQSKKVKIALFAVTLGFLGLFGSDLYLPALPKLQRVFHTSAAWVEFTVVIYLLGFAFSPLFYGPIADSRGRKPVVIAGLSLALLGSVVCGMSTAIYPFIIGRLIQGIGAGVTLCLFRVMLRDVVTGKALAVLASYTTIAFNLSPVLGMVIGAYLAYSLPWQYCFYLLSVVYALYILIYAIFCPETLANANKASVQQVVTNYKHIFRDMRFIACAMVSGLGFATIFAFATAGAIILQHQFHLSVITFGWVGATLSIASIAGKFLNVRLVKHFPVITPIRLGFALVGIIGFMLLLFGHHNVQHAIALICIASGSVALVLSNALSLGMRGEAQQIGYRASAYGMIQMLTGFVFCGLLAHFAQYALVSLAVFYLAIAAVGSCLSYALTSKRPQTAIPS